METIEGLGILGIISIAVLVVFFVMAARLKKIAENTNPISYGNKARQFYEARACELAGDRQGALKLYYQVLWRYPISFSINMGIKKEHIEEKIKELGGDPSIDYKKII